MPIFRTDYAWLVKSMNFIDMNIQIKTKLIFSFFIELEYCIL